jgi:hypothetical protein
MNTSVSRLKANYDCLSDMYKRGAFEDKVATTSTRADQNCYYPLSLELAGKKTGKRDSSTLVGYDLRSATDDLLAASIYLYTSKPGNLTTAEEREVVLCYHRSIILAYEVADYFLLVDPRLGKLLLDITGRIVAEFDKYLRQFELLFAGDAQGLHEITKQSLIVGLCGLNQYYREHRYDEALLAADAIKTNIDRWLPYAVSKRARAVGVRGLYYYVYAKIHMALGNFDQSEEAFQRSVERYSESVARLAQKFSRQKNKFIEATKRHEAGEINKATYAAHIARFAVVDKHHGLARDVALRRCALASSFGLAFQALMTGRVNESIRISSLARAVTRRNTGKIHRSYVDLIYFSAKRAQNSSDRRVLLQVQRNLFRSYLVFRELIPLSHYKNRALHQMALVKYYLAKYHKEEAVRVPTSRPLRGVKRKPVIWHFEKALSYLDDVIKYLSVTVRDKTLEKNLRLRAESAALLSHALANKALVEVQLNKLDKKAREGKPSGDWIAQAEELLDNAWQEADQHTQIQCEVGLAIAAVTRAKLDFHNITVENPIDDGYTRYPQPPNDKERERLIQMINHARDTLFKVIALNRDLNPRVKGTALLRLTELNLLRKAAWFDAQQYFEEYKILADRIEHEYCRRWAAELEATLTVSKKKGFLLVVAPGQPFDENLDRLEDYYATYVVNDAARQIADDAASKGFTRKDSQQSYLCRSYLTNFSITKPVAVKLIESRGLCKKLRSVSKAAAKLPVVGHRRPQAMKSAADKKSGIDKEGREVSTEVSSRTE